MDIPTPKDDVIQPGGLVIRQFYAKNANNEIVEVFKTMPYHANNELDTAECQNFITNVLRGSE
jgi:hypothetical protein